MVLMTKQDSWVALLLFHLHNLWHRELYIVRQGSHQLGKRIMGNGVWGTVRGVLITAFFFKYPKWRRGLHSDLW